LFLLGFSSGEVAARAPDNLQKLDFGAVVRNAAKLLISAAGPDPADSELS
jgi:hypothetical protein